MTVAVEQAVPEVLLTLADGVQTMPADAVTVRILAPPLAALPRVLC